MKSIETSGRSERYEPPASNRYEYCDFSSETWPAGSLLARQIQAKSYLANGFVHPEGIVEEDGVGVLASDIATPGAVALEATDDAWMEYSIGIKKGSTDWSPETGNLVAWRKYHARLDDLATYHFSREGLWNGYEEYLRTVDANPALKLAEPEGLGKTSDDHGVVKEFMRNEIQRAQGKGEVWFMGLVEKTVFGSWQHYWGPLAVRQVGEPRALEHRYVHDVRLVPTVMDIDRFFAQYYEHLKAQGDDLTPKQLKDFVYMADGMSDEVLGSEIAAFRAQAMQILEYGGEI